MIYGLIVKSFNGLGMHCIPQELERIGFYYKWSYKIFSEDIKGKEFSEKSSLEEIIKFRINIILGGYYLPARVDFT